MNLKYIYECIEKLQKELNGQVSFGGSVFAGLWIRVFWYYKDTSIQWQYVMSFSELDLINENSSFILYLIEKAKSEYAIKVLEIDNDRA
jgi:hypothetical protein